MKWTKLKRRHKNLEGCKIEEMGNIFKMKVVRSDAIVKVMLMERVRKVELRFQDAKTLAKQN